MAQDTNEIDAVMSEYDALWNGDFSKTDSRAPSVTVYSPTAGKVQGREDVEQLIRDMHAAFPNLQVTATDLLTGEDMLMGEWTMSGTHEGEFMGTPATGREVEVRGMSKILIEDGQVTEERVYSDPQEMMEQLGITGAEPAPPE